MSTFNKTNNLSYNFAPPAADASNLSIVREEVKFPCYQAMTITPADGAAEITPIHKTTFASLTIAAATSITAVTTNAQVGDEIILKVVHTGDRTLTLSTGFTGTVAATLAANGKTNILRFIFDGTNFIEVARVLQA